MFEKLLQPGEQAEFPASGSFVRIDQGTKVFVKTDGNETATLYDRDSGVFRPFNGLTITNVSAAAETIKIRVSTGQIIAAGDDSIVSIKAGSNVGITGDVGIDDATPVRVDVINQPDVTLAGDVGIDDATPLRVDVISQPAVTATVNHSNTLNTPLDVALTAVTATIIAAANANRLELMVKNSSSNTASIRIGGAAVAANKGFELEPGESALLSTSAAVYGYSVPGESVSVTELEKV